MKDFVKCGCFSTTAICGCIAMGNGRLSSNGFWSEPCTHGNAFIPYETDCPVHGKVDWTHPLNINRSQREPLCANCNHPRSEHSEEQPYECMNSDMCDCDSFEYVKKEKV